MGKIKYRALDEMKDSGIEWLAYLPSNWLVDRIQRHFSVRSEKVSDKKYQALSVTKRGILKQLENVAKTDNGDSRKKVLVNDFVINSRADRKGSCGVSSYDGSVSLICHVLKPAFSIFPRYSNYLFRNYYFSEEFYRWGTGIVDDLWSTNIDRMKRISIPVPSRMEQQKIANFLGIKTAQFDSIIAKKELLIQKLEEAKKSLISEVVTGKVKIVNGKLVERDQSEMKDSDVEWLGMIPKDWEIKKLKHIADCYPSNVDKKTNVGEKSVKLCNYTDVYYNDYITKDMDFMIATATKAQVIKFELKKGDIVLTKDSESPDDIAVASIVSEDIDNLVCGYHLSMIKVHECYNSLFMYFQFLSTGIRNYFETKANGVTRYGLSINSFLNLKMVHPNYDESIIISEFLKERLENTHKIIEQIKKQILQIKQAKQSLISEAVTGKIDLRDWDIVQEGEVS